MYPTLTGTQAVPGTRGPFIGKPVNFPSASPQPIAPVRKPGIFTRISAQIKEAINPDLVPPPRYDTPPPPNPGMQPGVNQNINYGQGSASAPPSAPPPEFAPQTPSPAGMHYTHPPNAPHAFVAGGYAPAVAPGFSFQVGASQPGFSPYADFSGANNQGYPPMQANLVQAPANPMDQMRAMIHAHMPVSHLLRHGVNPQTIKSNGLSLGDFYDSGYSLGEVSSFCENNYPNFQYIGLVKEHFLEPQQKWNLKSFCALVKQNLRQVCTDLNFNVNSMRQSGLTKEDIFSMNYTAKELVGLGLTGDGILQFGFSPFEMDDHLKCDYSTLSSLNLDLPIKTALRSACGWNNGALIGKMGFNSQNVYKLWGLSRENNYNYD